MSLLAGQVAIVTGAGQGLGRATALEMASEGCSVALLEQNGETLAEVVSEIRERGGACEGHELDITDHAACEAAIGHTVETHGKIDVLVNNAAISPPSKTILEDSLDEWRRTIAVDLEAVYMGSKLVAPHMVERKAGRIISIASVQGFAASGDLGAYNAAKGGIIALTKSMAVELGQYNILVNAVAPGFMRTPMSIMDGVDATRTPEFVDWYVERNRIPLRRTGYPEDVSGAVVFLASKYCRYITGHLLVVDGGLTSTF